MKLTIDSTEHLEDTLRVVGALYNVTLEVSKADYSASGESNGRPASNTSTASSAPRSGAKARVSKKRKPRKAAQARASANGHRRVNTGAVRVWARDNGYEIADRGRVPAMVLTAYQQAHKA